MINTYCVCSLINSRTVLFSLDGIKSKAFWNSLFRQSNLDCRYKISAGITLKDSKACFNQSSNVYAGSAILATTKGAAARKKPRTNKN